MTQESVARSRSLQLRCKPRKSSAPSRGAEMEPVSEVYPRMFSTDQLLSRHSRAGGNPSLSKQELGWIPAYAGMTEMEAFLLN
jgi:hypothetical protein